MCCLLSLKILDIMEAALEAMPYTSLRTAPLETFQLSDCKKWDILQKIYVRPHAR
jgi:hypothetical protein